MITADYKSQYNDHLTCGAA